MDVFPNFLLTKRKTQKGEINDILFKRRKTSNYHMEQATTSVDCAASGLLQTNTREPRSADKPPDSGWWVKNNFYLREYFIISRLLQARFFNETANAFRHRLRFL